MPPKKSTKLKFSEKSIDEPEEPEPTVLSASPVEIPASPASLVEIPASPAKKPRKPKILVSSEVISDKPKKISAPRPKNELKGILAPKNELKEIPAAEKVIVQMPVVPEVITKQQNQLKQLEIKRELEELRNKQAQMKIEQLREKERAKIELLQMKHQHENNKIQQKKRDIQVASVASVRPTVKKATPVIHTDTDEDTDEDDEIPQQERLEARKPIKKAVPVPVPALVKAVPVNPPVNLPQRRLHPSQYLAQFGF